MTRLIAILVLAATAQSAEARSARFFFSADSNLSDPADLDSAITSPPANLATGLDPLVDVGVGNPTALTRLYLWVQLGGGEPTTIDSFGATLVTTGDVSIQTANIWQNNWIVRLPGGGTAAAPNDGRWLTSPGLVNAGGTQLLSVGPALGALTDPGTGFHGHGVTTVSAPAGDVGLSDDQYDAATKTALLGYVEFRGSAGDIHLTPSVGLLPSESHVIYAGLDDVLGLPPHPTLDTPEATIVPEPASLTLAIAAYGVWSSRRRTPEPSRPLNPMKPRAILDGQRLCRNHATVGVAPMDEIDGLILPNISGKQPCHAVRKSGPH